MDSEFEKHTLSNGVRVLMDRMDHVRSVAMGFFLEAGSRDESSPENGLAHVIEHMLFKGTERRDALRIATESNTLGGHFNAFTTQDTVCLHARVVDEKLDAALDLLADLLGHSRHAPEELERERNVILEEIYMYQDTPDEQVVDNFTEALWQASSLGRPILGTPETVSAFTREHILDFTGRHFAGDRLVVALAGNFDPQHALAEVERQLAGFQPKGAQRTIERPAPVFSHVFDERDLEQEHICIGCESITRASEDRFAYSIMNWILGGGMNSRIFQEVREKRGLAYSIGSFFRPYVDTGYFAISGGTRPENAEEVMEIVLRETRKIYNEAVDAEELESAREALKGGVLMGLESTNWRMHRLADMELTFGRYIEVDEVIRRLDAVTVKDVQDVAERYLKGSPVGMAVIGPKALPQSDELKF